MKLPSFVPITGTLLCLCADVAQSLSFSNTILVFARDAIAARSATAGLDGYGIPFESVIVPAQGITLPSLNSSATDGNYGGIIVMGEVSYQYTSGWRSAITPEQWSVLYNYQSTFGVRMVRIDAYPTPVFGVTVLGGCCNAGVTQPISISSTDKFPTANIKAGVEVSTEGLYHYPASINTAGTTFVTTEVARFGPSTDGTFAGNTTAAVINDFGTRQQMVWFTSWAPWSTASNFLQHAFIHWMTRGLFVGKRKLYLSVQVDDMHLNTELYFPSGDAYRATPADMEAHAIWQDSLNSRLPAGSNFFLDIAHNGNGDIEAALDIDSSNVCSPTEAVDYIYPPDTALEFTKPLGSGTDLWPASFTSYEWSETCAKLDDLALWFTVPANRDAFGHLSHTFTHLALNNATYSDASKEIYFNIAWMNQVGFNQGAHFSPAGLVPPAITGLHNGDVIKAWMDNGINYVVGDNSRPLLRNPGSSFWPLITTTAGNGYDGLVVIPRWATTIYYNCATLACTHNEWIAIAGGTGTSENFLEYMKSSNIRNLLGLHHDPYMKHQANMKSSGSGVPTRTIGSYTGQMSLVQIFVEVVAQEMAALTNWPVLTLKHDDIGRSFVDRMTLDQCKPNLKYTLTPDRTTITGVEVTTEGNTCSVPVPVTFPGSASAASGSATEDKVGNEPLIMWTDVTGSPVSFALSPPVTL